MVTPIGSISGGRSVDQLKSDAPRISTAQHPASVGDVAVPKAAPVTTPAAAMAAEGAPIDTGKIAAIKAAIAGGTFKIDPHAIAAKMIAQDLPAQA